MSRPETMSAPASAAEAGPRPELSVVVTLYDEVGTLDELLEQLDRGERWWDERWASFTPEDGWRAPTFPDGWEATPLTEAPPPSAYRTLDG